MTDKIWRVLIWSAVSSKPQAGDDKESLPQQEAAGRAFAQSVGGQVVDVLSVPGHSRSYGFWQDVERDVPAYGQLRRHCEAADFDVLWCRAVDRLGRTSALISQVVWLVEDSMGGEVFVQDFPHVLGHKGPGNRYMENIGGASSDHDQARRKRNHRMGMFGRVRRGLPANHWPHGYRPVRNADGEIVGGDFTEGIEAIRFATTLFFQGASYSQIARDLEAHGYVAPGEHHWWQGQVREMLHNDTYAGRPSWGPEKSADVSDRYPALWDEDTWRRIIRERENRRKRQHHRRTSSPFLDVAFCARCQQRLTLYTDHNDGGKTIYRWLSCRTHKRDSALCHRNSIRLEVLFDVMQNWLEDNLDPATYASHVGPEPGQAERDELTQVARQIKELDARRTRLGHALAGGTMAFDVYSRVDADLVAQGGKLNQDATRLRELLSAMPDRRAHRAELERLAGEPGTGLLSLPWPEINAGLLRLRVRMNVEEGKVVDVRFL